MSSPFSDRISFSHSIKIRLLVTISSLILVMMSIVFLDMRLGSYVQETANWKHEAETGRTTFQEIIILFNRASSLSDPDQKRTALDRLGMKFKNMETYFHLLRDGNPVKNVPPAMDPYIKDAFLITDDFWHQRVAPLIHQNALVKPDRKTSRMIEEYFENFSAAIEVGISLSDEVLAAKLTKLRTLQVLLTVFGGLLAAFTTFYIRNTANRIEAISSIAGKINRGQNHLRAPARGSDELAHLGVEFNQMTNRLLEERQFVDNIIRTMGEIFVLVSPTGRILKVNDACLQSTGFELDELIQKDVRTLVADETFFGTVMLSISKYGYQRDSSIALQTKFGTTLQVALSGTALRDSSGAVIGAALLFKDMTGYILLLEEGQKRAAAEAATKVEREKAMQLAELNAALKTSQMQVVETSKFAALGEMAGGIAHEINNPLAIIVGKAAQLKDMAEEQQFVPSNILIETASRIEDTAMRVAKIIKGLRTFARDASQEPLCPVQITSIINETLDLCREKFRTIGIALKLDDVPDDLVIECRSVQISQVLLNLLNNARDAVENTSNAWVKLGVEDFGDYVAISVTDSGTGLAPGVREKIMQPFFTTKPVGKGTGLGLSISKNIMENQGGALHYDADCPNTRFVLTIRKTKEQHLAA